MEGWSFAKMTAMTMGYLGKYAEQSIEDTQRFHQQLDILKQSSTDQHTIVQIEQSLIKREQFENEWIKNYLKFYKAIIAKEQQIQDEMANPPQQSQGGYSQSLRESTSNAFTLDRKPNRFSNSLKSLTRYLGEREKYEFTITKFESKQSSVQVNEQDCQTDLSLDQIAHLEEANRVQADKLGSMQIIMEEKIVDKGRTIATQTNPE